MSDTDEILAAWPSSEPPADFADRVVGRLGASAQSPPPRRRRWLPAAVVAFGAAASLALWFAPTGGDHRVAGRETVSIGRRAVAVLEPGAALRYRVGWLGDAEIDQSEGEVFYRVERGGAFRVHTPSGDVVVHGTCFRVEVRSMKPVSSGLIGAGVGAALTAAVFVTVYEGKVSLRNPQGQVSLSAGARAEASPGAAPSTAPSPAKPSAPSASGPSLAALPHDELARRAEEQRGEIIGLHDQVRRLRSELESAQAAASGQAGEKHRGFSLEPSKEELAELAKSCTLKWDSPPLGMDAPTWGTKMQARAGLSAEEAERINKVIAELHEQTIRELRALYVEVTGDRAHAEAMTPEAIVMELHEKSARLDVQTAYQRLAQERAGQAPPPQTLVGTTPIERTMRLVTTLGDRMERALATVIGAERARDLRKRNNGWGSRSVSSNGCPGKPETE